VLKIIEVYQHDSAIFVSALVRYNIASTSTCRFDDLEWQALRKAPGSAEAIDVLPHGLCEDIEITHSTQQRIVFTVTEELATQATLAFGPVLQGGEVNSVVMTS
jgi:hypothetical protein